MDSEFDLTSLRAEFVDETLPLALEVDAKLLLIERALESKNERDENGAGNSPRWREVLGFLHTIKGNCGIVRFTGAEALAHAMEDVAKATIEAEGEAQLEGVRALLSAVEALRVGIGSPEGGTERSNDALAAAVRALKRTDEGTNGTTPERAQSARPPRTTPPGDSVYSSYQGARITDVRISAEKLDRLLELVGELSTHHSRVAETFRRLSERIASSDEEASSAGDLVDLLGKTIAEFRVGITQARLLPLSMATNRFHRAVRDLCLATGKRVRFDVVGAETVVDKTIVDAIGEPLLHIVRNAIDHGLELPEARIAAGKAVEGRLVLDVAQRGSELAFTIRDDGRGIIRKKLVARARTLGIVTEGWADEDILELIFFPDVSTAEKVTEISGRGVGLDAARRAVERIGGAIDVLSVEGRGTEFRIRVPLTLTLQRVLLMRCRAEVYALGLGTVVGAHRVTRGDVHTIDGRAFVRFREALLPLHDLARALGVPGESDHASSFLCVVVEDGYRAFGLLVDDVLGQQDVVLKELDPELGHPVGIAGATVLADGRVAMVIDPRAIAGAQRGTLNHKPRSNDRPRQT